MSAGTGHLLPYLPAQPVTWCAGRGRRIRPSQWCRRTNSPGFHSPGDWGFESRFLHQGICSDPDAYIDRLLTLLTGQSGAHMAMPVLAGAAHADRTELDTTTISGPPGTLHRSPKMLNSISPKWRVSATGSGGVMCWSRKKMTP